MLIPFRLLLKTLNQFKFNKDIYKKEFYKLILQLENYKS